MKLCSSFDKPLQTLTLLEKNRNEARNSSCLRNSSRENDFLKRCCCKSYEGWIVPKGSCVLGGDGLVGGGGV